MKQLKFASVIPIEKGWSEDCKYRVEREDGIPYLLRVSPIASYEKRKALFDLVKKVSQLGIPMCRPVEFGICEKGVYTFYTWIDGEDAETVIPLLPEEEQYALGLTAGEILKRIHLIPAPAEREKWHIFFERKARWKIQKYKESSIQIEGGDRLISYIESNIALIEGRPQCFQHGDYHIGNMMMENGKLVIIDFDRFDFGDPWEEFNRIVWCAQSCPPFAAGMVNGYFEGSPPIAFFRLLALYIASNTLSSVVWAQTFGQGEVETMTKQAQDVLSWFDNMKNPVPAWYRSYAV